MGTLDIYAPYINHYNPSTTVEWASPTNWQHSISELSVLLKDAQKGIVLTNIDDNVTTELNNVPQSEHNLNLSPDVILNYSVIGSFTWLNFSAKVKDTIVRGITHYT